MSTTQVQVEAVVRQRYKGVWYLPGESFEVDSESEALDMEACRPPLIKRTKRAYENRAMAPDATAEQAKTTASSVGKNQKYERRDMRAR